MTEAGRKRQLAVASQRASRQVVTFICTDVKITAVDCSMFGSVPESGEDVNWPEVVGLDVA
jgi:hypothetical protein